MRGSKGLGTDLSGKASSFLPLSMLAVGFCSYFLSKVFPSPGDLPNPGIELRSPAFQVNSLLFEPVRKLFIKLREFSPIPTLLRGFFFFLIMNGYWIFLSFFLFCWQHAGSQFCDQGSNLCPLQRKQESLPLDCQELPGFFT